MGAESSKQLHAEGPQAEAGGMAARTQVARVKAVMQTKDRVPDRAKSMRMAGKVATPEEYPIITVGSERGDVWGADRAGFPALGLRACF